MIRRARHASAPPWSLATALFVATRVYCLRCPCKSAPMTTGKLLRPGYRGAIEWLAYNDDCYWLGDSDPAVAVSAAMVRDLWGVETASLRTFAALAKAHPM
jgi:hypothetical protein